jgi:hypothetical protein
LKNGDNSLTGRSKHGEIETLTYLALTRIPMKTVYFKQAALFIAALSFATAALAQYVWLDAKGVKQFSDMPPPASVPKTRILKQPASAQRAETPAAVGADQNGKQADAPAENVKSQPPMTSAEKNTDFLKRRNEQAEKDKKTAEDAKRKADSAQNCERTRSYARSLEIGGRISRTNQNGERSFISDEERARDLQEAKRMLADCK